MNASKLYYIISHYIDQDINDIENMKGLYIDIKNGYTPSLKTVYGSRISAEKVKELSEDKTKKEIDNYFEELR